MITAPSAGQNFKKQPFLHLINTVLPYYNRRGVSVYPVFFRARDLVRHSRSNHSISRPLLEGPDWTRGHLFGLGRRGEVGRRVAVDSGLGIGLLHPLVVGGVVVLAAGEDGFLVLHLCVGQQEEVLLLGLQVREGVCAFSGQ